MILLKVIDKLNKCIIITMPWNELETYLNDRLKGTSPLIGHEQAHMSSSHYTWSKQVQYISNIAFM